MITGELSEATPVQIDTEIARLHGLASALESKIAILTNRVLDHSGLRTYVSGTWTSKAHYVVTGTFDEGVERLRKYDAAVEVWRASNYDQALRPQPLSNYAGYPDVERTVAERAKAMADCDEIWQAAYSLEAEWIRRPWSRYFLVVSSPGHIHSSTHCGSCRRTTAYGWMPEMSGQTEAESLAKLGPYAEAMCSVCFPNAPVAGKTKVTKAKALKMSAGTYAIQA
jgi:hypothetical protein